MKLRWLCTAAILAVFILCSAKADELLVSAEGAYSSLTEAVAAARAGDTIRLSADVYSSATESYPIVINKPLVIIGEPGAMLEGKPLVTLLKINAPDVTVKGVAFRFLRLAVYDAGDRLTLSDCTFAMYDDMYRVSSCAIWMGGVRGCEISGCAFEKCGVCIAGPPLSDTSKGLPVLTGMFEVGEEMAYFATHTITRNTVNGKPLYYLVNENGSSVPEDAGGVIAACCDGLTLSGMDVSDSSMGLELAYCSNVLLNNVKADHCGIFGVYLAYCNSGTLSGVSCEAANHGIDVRASSNIYITDCAIVECEQGVFLSFSTDCIADGCDIARCGNGAFFAVGRDNQISGCTVKGNENGIYLQNESDALVCGNRILGNTAAGVRFLRSDGYALDNTLIGNRTGILAAENTELTLWGNVFSSNLSAALYLRDTAAGKISRNLFKNTEKIFMQFDGTNTNLLICDNTFCGGENRILNQMESIVPLAKNTWEK